MMTATMIDAPFPVEPACLPLLREPLAVGLSGGRDSVALLRLLVQRGCCVHACHVHHGIRGAAADADAAFCERLCAEWGVPFRCVAVDVPALARQTHQSLETAARNARRAALAEAARQWGCRVVALAQHADDQAETVLFRLARGSAGLRGIRPVHEAQGMVWIRPLLSVPRAALTAWLQEIKQPWVEDATNAVPDVARNRIRHEVLPALSRAVGHESAPVINRSARLQHETHEALETALSLLPLTDPQGRLYLPALQDKPAAFRKAVLHRYLTLGGVPDISEELVCELDGILSPDAPAARINLPGGMHAHRKEKRLLLGTAAGDVVAVGW